MNQVPILAVALLLNSAQPLLLGTALSIGAGAISVAAAQAQSAEAVAKVAQGITVRIEGATQGSGVLVKRDGNFYTVLTAWHVVSGQRPGEELDIYTPDGKRHPVVQGSIQRLGDVDMAILSFSSTNSYEQARVGDVKSISMGSPVFVSGFPLPTSAVPTRLLRFLKGDVIANASVAIPNGYQLLYSNQTLPGMSGGSVLNTEGELVGIHGQGETDSKMSEQEGIVVKSGTNQAVPIAYYRQSASGEKVAASTTKPDSADDYLAKAAYILSKGLSRNNKQSEKEFIEAISLAGSSLELSPRNAEALGIMARARAGVGQPKQAIRDADEALRINPNNWNALFARANAKSDLGDQEGAIVDYSRAIALRPEDALAYLNRSLSKRKSGNNAGAIDDLNKALAIKPISNAYLERGAIKAEASDWQGAVADFNRFIEINPRDASVYALRGRAKYALGDKDGSLRDFNQSIALDSRTSATYLRRGIVKSDLGDRTGSIADYTRYILSFPREPKALYLRSSEYYQNGNKRLACEDLEKASSLGLAEAISQMKRMCN